MAETAYNGWTDYEMVRNLWLGNDQDSDAVTRGLVAGGGVGCENLDNSRLTEGRYLGTLCTQCGSSAHPS